MMGSDVQEHEARLFTCRDILRYQDYQKKQTKPKHKLESALTGLSEAVAEDSDNLSTRATNENDESNWEADAQFFLEYYWRTGEVHESLTINKIDRFMQLLMSQ